MVDGNPRTLARGERSVKSIYLKSQTLAVCFGQFGPSAQCAL
jgi:hypothetical protein